MTSSKRTLRISRRSTIFKTPRRVHHHCCALPLLTVSQEPKLWYGIGILYDRYGSLEYAEEAFSQVMRMEPNFEKANEIYFRLGIIYKQQQKFNQSLDVSIAFYCMRRAILTL